METVALGKSFAARRGFVLVESRTVFADPQSNDDDEQAACAVTRAMALAHYQLKGPLRLNFVRNYINPNIMQYEEVTNATEPRLWISVLTMACVAIVSPWTYAAILLSKKCPLNHVLQYTMKPHVAGQCNMVSLWSFLQVPLALVGVRVFSWCAFYVFEEQGRRAMLLFYYILDMALPFLDPLKYRNSLRLYTYVSQGYVLLLIQMAVMAVVLESVAAIVVGYAVGNVLVRVAPVLFAPPGTMIGMLHSELMQWTEEPTAQSLFLRLLEHNQNSLVLSNVEFSELRKASKPGGTLEKLFEDAQNHIITFSIDAETTTERPVHFSSLYLKSVHLPLRHADSRGKLRKAQDTDVSSTPR